MHLTHGEAMAVIDFAALLVAFLLGRITSGTRERDLDEAFEEGYREGHDDGFDHRGDWDRDRLQPEEEVPRRPVVLLEPGPTAYPELVALAREPLDGPESHANGPVTTPWLLGQRTWMEALYPIPGTPQWEARHPMHQEAS